MGLYAHLRYYRHQCRVRVYNSCGTYLVIWRSDFNCLISEANDLHVRPVNETNPCECVSADDQIAISVKSDRQLVCINQQSNSPTWYG